MKGPVPTVGAKMNFFQKLYVSFYVNSQILNGENTPHNYYACLAMAMLEILLCLNTVTLVYAFWSFTFPVEIKALFLNKMFAPLVAVAIVTANYAYFATGKRYQSLLSLIEPQARLAIRFLGLRWLLTSFVFEVVLVVLMIQTN